MKNIKNYLFITACMMIGGDIQTNAKRYNKRNRDRGMKCDLCTKECEQSRKIRKEIESKKQELDKKSQEIQRQKIQQQENERRTVNDDEREKILLLLSGGVVKPRVSLPSTETGWGVDMNEILDQTAGLLLEPVERTSMNTTMPSTLNEESQDSVKDSWEAWLDE